MKISELQYKAQLVAYKVARRTGDVECSQLDNKEGQTMIINANSKDISVINAKRKVYVHRVGLRTTYIDGDNQEYVKAFNKWWLYPQQIDRQ